MNHDVPGLQRVLQCASFCLWLMIIVTVSLQAAEPTREQIEFFENEIRPLLVKHCYECHSDEKKLEGELRVNGRAALLHGGASGPAVVPGRPKESLMIEAVQYRSLEMPPNGKLPQSDIDKLVRWVEMGLPWPKEETADATGARASKSFSISDDQRTHWAFQPIENPPLPVAKEADWNRNPIDQFLSSRWQVEGIPPNELADRGTLLRRVTYDLTGLPPTVEELHQFLSDESPSAWEHVVNRLLASPHYGERWGRHWLDVVRYADTSGNPSDHPVPDAYKYRNYVIESLNKDKPYDQFLREQYAGDLLAREAPPEQFEELVTATGQLAIARRFGFNDTNFLDFHLTMHDLLDTMGQSVLGLTIGCARCHDHKFEPISAKDYYALYGIFSSSRFTFPGAEEVKHPKDLVPAIPPEQASQRRHERKRQLADLDRQIAEMAFPLLNLEGNFEGIQAIPTTWKHDAEVELATNSSSPFTNVFPQGTQAVQLPNSAKNLGIRRPVSVQTPETLTPFHFNIDFRNVGGESGGDGYYRIALDHPENGFSAAVELFVNARQLAVREGDRFREIAPLTLSTWYNLQVQVNWHEKQFSGVLSDGTDQWKFESLPFNPHWDGIANSWVVDGHVPGDQNPRPLRQLDHFFIQDSPFLPANETISLTDAKLQERRQQLREPVARLRQEREALAQQPVYPTVYGVQEGTPANTRLQFRGEPGRLGEEVPRGFLEILGGEQLPENCQESGRRQLAEWLTAPENPLTARVMVNRIWFYHFGQGIVATPNDFGIRGAPPTHPELLDWLATRFQQQGYSIKAMHRLILNSRAYQLASSSDSKSREKDPDNTLFWHHNRRRLDAESLRDTWLFLSRELDSTVGGPHPFPAEPTWRFSQHNPFDAVYPSNQRTVYLMTQRIKRHPFLALFDGPDPNATTGKRELTTTPSQALFMMNNEFLHQRSQVYAQRLLTEFPEEQDQIVQLYEEAYTRRPTATELDTAHRFRTQYREKIPEDSNRLSAGLAAYVRVILSSNEFLYMD